MKKYFPLLPLDEDRINPSDIFLLFETSRYARDEFKSYVFRDPVDVIEARRYGQVRAAFEKIERMARKYYLAGYFSYELGYFFEGLEALAPPSGGLLIRLGVFERPGFFDHRTGRRGGPVRDLFRTDGGSVGRWRIEDMRFSLSEKDYAKKIRRIKDCLRRGLTYQVNFTGKFRFSFSGSPFSLFRHLQDRQPVPYGAFCKFGRDYVLSLSPELFFRRDGNAIYSRPMKGTAPTGRGLAEDARMILRLGDDKNRAENLMIADLVRNDLGRICDAGSVRAVSLFDVEKYRTLFQMTSTVRGRLCKGTTYFDIFRSLFPSGSVTGAPKIRTMEIIRRLESGARGVYCGALGMIFPGRRAVFNLPIRTVCISRGQGQMGAGGGIVYDSEPRKEYRECLLKAKFLTAGNIERGPLADQQPEFSLLETLLWDNGFRYLAGHLRRMRGSALYFHFPYKKARVMGVLKRLGRTLKAGKRYRVRLLLDRYGSVRAEKSILPALLEKNRTARATLTAERTDPADVFYYHKTTRRSLYDSEYRRARGKGFFDVIFLNRRGEVTEGAISNIVIQKNGKRFTPPVSSGLLPGIYRGILLRRKAVTERKLSFNDLKTADKIFLCNSVRGMTEVELKTGKGKRGKGKEGVRIRK